MKVALKAVEWLKLKQLQHRNCFNVENQIQLNLPFVLVFVATNGRLFMVLSSTVITDVGGEVDAKYPPSSSSLLQPVVKTMEPNSIETIMCALLEDRNVNILVGFG